MVRLDIVWHICCNFFCKNLNAVKVFLLVINVLKVLL